MTQLLVVGDVHGALAECLAIVPRLEERVGQIDGILQAGDLGVFRHESPLDKATRRFAAKDPTELGIAPFISGDSIADWPVWFTRGNHEDFDLLRRSGHAIDPFARIQHLPDATISTLFGLRILALGGIDGIAEDPLPPRGGKHFRQDDLEEAAILHEKPDILLTHAGPTGYSVIGNPLAGSDALLELVRIVRPRWHFFGHHGHPPRPAKMGESWIVPLNQPDVLRVPNRDGGVGLLDVTQEAFSFVMPNLRLIGLEEIAANPIG